MGFGVGISGALLPPRIMMHESYPGIMEPSTLNPDHALPQAAD